MPPGKLRVRSMRVDDVTKRQAQVIDERQSKHVLPPSAAPCDLRCRSQSGGARAAERALL
jgi:hypothetical protein